MLKESESLLGKALASVLQPYLLWATMTLFLLIILLVWSGTAAGRRNMLARRTFGVLEAGSRLETALAAARLDAYPQIAPINAALLSLHRLTADNPSQHQRVQSMLTQTSAASGPLLAELDASLRSFTREEWRLLAERQLAERAADGLLGRISVIAIAVDLAAGVWGYSISRRREMDRSDAETCALHMNQSLAQQVREVQRLNQQLGLRVDEKALALEAAVEKLEQSNAELERFAYVAAHDLQEPLRQVAGFNGLLALRYGDRLDAVALGYINNSIEGVRRLESMVKGLLDYSLITPVSVRLLPVEVAPLVWAVVEHFKAEILHTGGSVHVDVEAGAVVMADAVLLRQALCALVSNALKFTRPDAPPQVQLTVQSGSRPKVWRITISDNGIGIDKAFFSQAFQLFARLHPVGIYAGAGVGLAIAKKVVGYHGGILSIGRSASGAGSSFCITLPYHPIDSPGGN